MNKENTDCASTGRYLMTGFIEMITKMVYKKGECSRIMFHKERLHKDIPSSKKSLGKKISGNRILGKFRKALALSAVCCLLFSISAQAEWQNEHLGPGEAVWVGEGAAPAPNAADQNAASSDQVTINPDGTAQSPDAAAPGGQTAPTNPDGTSGAPAAQAPDGNGAASAATDAQASGGSTENKTPDGGGSLAPGVESAGEAGSQTAETGQDTQTAEGTNPSADPYLVASGGRMIDLRKPMIALTYDDGPYAPVGNRIMDVAERYNGRVTFFMVGNRVPSYQTEVRRMVTNGHEVANHTYDHKYLNKLNAASIRAQVENCNNVIQNVTGVRPKLMRLPGGNKNATVLQNINMPIILWNIDTRDWDTRNAQKTINAVLGKVKDGDIVLMHELYSSTAEATETIIPALAAQGYQFVTVSELAQFKGKALAQNQIYYSIR